MVVNPLVNLPNRFQSSSGLSTGCNYTRFNPQGKGFDVSILIRPFDRMQLSIRWAGAPTQTRFNPHPAFRPDATSGCSRVRGWATTCFNPHPAFRPDATGRGGQDAEGRVVSILIRPFDRMQREFDSPSGHLGLFQSSSGLSTGCNRDFLLILTRRRKRFPRSR